MHVHFYKNNLTAQITVNNMNKYQSIEDRAIALLAKRGITGHIAAERFVNDFKAYLIYFDATGVGSAEETLTLLENDNNLTDGNILCNNFRKDFTDLISDALLTDDIFPVLFNIMLDNNGKGVGHGELALPLILSNYQYSNYSDGLLNGTLKVEVKLIGASLKPVPTGLTEKGLVDALNNKYWAGTVPGLRTPKKFKEHLAIVTNPALYSDYFKELYVGCDPKALKILGESAEAFYEDAELFNTAIGKFALSEYKRVDGWHNIIFIDPERQEVVNIADVTDISDLNLKFQPKLSRKKDTQAIADGYVNVRF